MSEKLAALARTWIGTPYVHQAASKGAGCDCLGLVRGLWRETFGTEPETAPHYTPDWGEARGDEVLWSAATRLMLDASALPWQAGQILLFRMQAGAVAKHLGVLSRSGPTMLFVHAYTGHGVIENSLSAPWRRRVVARFTFPEKV